MAIAKDRGGRLREERKSTDVNLQSLVGQVVRNCDLARRRALQRLV
jgi:hypothetical protein